MTADPALYDRLEQLAAEATPGPWACPQHTSTVYSENDPAQWIRVASSVDPADAALIVALVNAAPHLIAAARRATDLEQRVQALAEEWDRSHDWIDAAARLRGLLDGSEGR